MEKVLLCGCTLEAPLKLAMVLYGVRRLSEVGVIQIAWRIELVGICLNGMNVDSSQLDLGDNVTSGGGDLKNVDSVDDLYACLALLQICKRPTSAYNT